MVYMGFYRQNKPYTACTIHAHTTHHGYTPKYPYFGVYLGLTPYTPSDTQSTKYHLLHTAYLPPVHLPPTHTVQYSTSYIWQIWHTWHTGYMYMLPPVHPTPPSCTTPYTVYMVYMGFYRQNKPYTACTIHVHTPPHHQYIGGYYRESEVVCSIHTVLQYTQYTVHTLPVYACIHTYTT